MSKSPSAEKLFNDLDALIRESNALLERGALLELAGLDEQVRTLCEAVMQLSNEERKRYADRFQRLLDELKKLGEALVAHRDILAGEIRGLSEHRKASVAYRSAEPKKDAEG